MLCASDSLSTEDIDSKLVASLDESRGSMWRGIDLPRQAIHVPRYDPEGMAPGASAGSDEGPCGVASGYHIR